MSRRTTGLVGFVLLGTHLALCLLLGQEVDGLIITSVIAGDKKFKTVSFDSKFLKPLMFEKEMPNTEFRRHRTMRPPKFDIDVNIPIKLPLEEEYPQEEYKKPVESNIFFQTGEISEPSYKGGGHAGKSKQPKRPLVYKDEYAAASGQQEQRAISPDQGLSPATIVSEGIKGILPAIAKSIKFQPKLEYVSNIQAGRRSNARSDTKDNPNSYPPLYLAPQLNEKQAFAQSQKQFDLNQAASYASAQRYHAPKYEKEPEFIPGGYVNLQLSGPTGGPQMTYEDYDREKWAQQLSQTPGAMPYPILNYHQLQNFYGGLGTFTNGLAEHRYTEHNLLDKIKSSFSHLTKFHIG